MQKTDVTHYSIAVLAGGWSDERDISMLSGEQCTHALKEAGFQHVELFDVCDLNFISRLIAHEFDIAFVAMHGKYGEDGCIQGLLETLHIPYTCSGVLASALGTAKEMAKAVYREANITTPQDICIQPDDDITTLDTHTFVEALGLPMIVKPTNNGSSYGVHYVTCEDDIIPAIKDARAQGSAVLVEQMIQGVEITVPVIGTKNPRALPIVEIRFDAPIYDLAAKNEPASLHHVIPAQINSVAYERAQKAAVFAHIALGCSGVSRSDFIVDNSDVPYILETNMIPGMTEHSLIPDAARHDGISFPELCTFLVECAVEEHKDLLIH